MSQSTKIFQIDEVRKSLLIKYIESYKLDNKNILKILHLSEEEIISLKKYSTTLQHEILEISLGIKININTYRKFVKELNSNGKKSAKRKITEQSTVKEIKKIQENISSDDFYSSTGNEMQQRIKKLQEGK